MREWGFLPSSSELEAVPVAAKAFRDKWNSIRPPFPAQFDGSIADVQAIDYMDYEGIDFPQGGVEAAALVCGEVLRRAAGLEWVISYRGDWFVASQEDQFSSIAICPLARLHEMECGQGPGPRGMFAWFIQKAAFECLLVCGSEFEDAIRDLLECDGGYLERVERTFAQLRRSG